MGTQRATAQDDVFCTPKLRCPGFLYAALAKMSARAPASIVPRAWVSPEGEPHAAVAILHPFLAIAALAAALATALLMVDGCNWRGAFQQQRQLRPCKVKLALTPPTRPVA